MIACLAFSQSAWADRIGTVGDWDTWTDTDHKPYAKVRQPEGHPMRDFSMHCGAPGKVEFSLNDYRAASGDVPALLIADDAKQESFKLDLLMGYSVKLKGTEADRLLASLLREESAARAAGAKSWTFTFFINDPKTAGYSLNVGGVQQVRDFLVKRCAEPAGSLEAATNKPKPQSDTYLTSQPFAAPDRIHFLQFYQDGRYQIANHRSGQEEWRGVYNVSSGTLVLDPDTPNKMICGFSYDARKNVVLSGCQYSGVYVALKNL